MSVMIGIDPHKGSHAAAAVDSGERVIAELEVRATKRATASIPHAARLAALPPTEQYAAVELFRGSMTCHSLVVKRDDDSREQWLYDPDDVVLMDAVPIRLPQTLTIEERLPRGAAAALLNRSHTNTDLVVPINAVEKRLVESIDGRRPITEIAAGAGLGVEDHGRVSGFFRHLFRCDQVVFDLSGITTARSPL